MDPEALVRILRTYDASVDGAAVKAAFRDARSAEFLRWATVHLTPDTLLSPDELEQYAALEELGLAEKLAMSSDLTAARVLSDQEVKEAIEELNRSTQAITRQTDTLKQQQEALHRLVKGAHQGSEERAALEAGQTRKWEAQRSELASARAQTEELSEALDSRVLELDQRSSGAGGAIQKTVDALFHSDDKLLSSLQKLGFELETEDPEVQGDVAMLRETCARLIKFTVEGIRTRLDRIYLESLEVPPQSSASNRVSLDEVSTLQEELESLYAEILPVAQMSAEQQFLEPALKALAAKNGQSLAKSAQATSYIHECLDYLIDRVQDLMARLEAFQAFQLAADAVLEIARAELATKVAESTSTEVTQKHGTSQQDVMSPARPRPKQRPRYSSGTAGIGEEPPLEEILRALAISSPQGEEGAPADLEAHVRELSSTLAGRRAKVDDVAQNVQETFETAAIKQVTDAKLAIQLIRDSILAESPYGEVRLVDPEIEGSIAVLSQELGNVDEKLKLVDADVTKLRGRNPKRDELITRWGS
ncbi:HAUS augmin-like complex subunit 3 N-terminal domain-containing protein [Madurella fahalii]|uniref:HAUS augmin-like complex subunit 3 N-terminal domain-containing protein n=1 Tax=Madurella fahalii TaxID=1157608 RepID=A0ABQ0GQE7_9PEZI